MPPSSSLSSAAMSLATSRLQDAGGGPLMKTDVEHMYGHVSALVAPDVQRTAVV